MPYPSDAMKSNPCKFVDDNGKLCGSPFHTAMYHKHRPLKTTATLQTKKPMNKIGKVQKKTQSAVDKWKRTQKPNHAGYFTCYIGGDLIPYLVAEHPYSKARHPELRTDQIFEPVCNEHNALKGSLDIDDFLNKYPQYKATVKKRYL
jgi:hypothetical protein